jgi:hypothetical protein
MKALLYEFATWAELIGILIPLCYIIITKPKGREIRPLVLYIYVASIFIILSTTISKIHEKAPVLEQGNLVIYNTHSIIRVLFASWYIAAFKGLWSSTLIRIILPVYCIAVLINFLFLHQSFLNFSDRLHSAESVLLLFICIVYFLSTIIDVSDTIWMNHPSFVFVAGLNFYEAITFFVFLFFNLINVHESYRHSFGEVLMILFAFSYIVFCICLTLTIKKSIASNRSI